MQAIENLRFGDKRVLPLILQSEASECALACLTMVANYFGYQTDLAELRRKFTISLKGVNLEQLIEMARQLNLVGRPLRLELDELASLAIPCILHWDINHFVVLRAVRGQRVIIHDPAVGELSYSLDSIADRFTGIALELSPGMDFKRKAAPQGIELRRLLGKIVGLKRSLVQVLLLAIMLEAFAVALPMLSQWITDEAIVSGEHELLGLLCLGVIALGIIQASIAALRSWIGLYISTTFSLQWMSNIMTHMLRLPIEFFERRHLGDIVSRFGSVRRIEQSLTTALIDAFLDGLLAIGTLIMMLLYNPVLALISMAAVCLYVTIRLVRISSMRIANQGLLAKQSAEQTYFLETIRGVRSIKLFNRENDRRSSWLNYLVISSNADITLQKLNLFFSSLWSYLSAVEKGTVLLFGAQAVIDNRMTLGMLFAFLSYKEQFSSRVSSLVERLIDFKMLNVHAERLADIVLAEPEEQIGIARLDQPDDLGISLENVSFRYGPPEPPVLAKVSLDIPFGQCVALVGPSGGGKSTLLKLMLSILKPSAGKVCIGGMTITKLGLRNYRELIGTVMQDDHVYAGSIFDNICFFESKPDKEWLHECARLACIHDEIVAMPMGYHTLVGDMGTVLSGGQRQRILLARALYKKPRILFLDEATSHLDLENERKINQAIASLNITRVIIAHRPQSIAIADRVFVVHRGRVMERKPGVELQKNLGEKPARLGAEAA